MSRRSSQQQPLFSVEMFVPEPYPKGSVYDVLARYGGFLIRRSDFPESEYSLGGNRGYCPVQLSALVLLQQQHGWTDRETVRRASMDLQVKACLGLGIDQKGPSQPSLCRHRQWMQELGLEHVYMERLRDLLEALELVSDDEAVLIDSVPINGAGQQLDSYNLLAGAVRNGLRALAKAQDRPATQVAELGLDAYMNRSIKGRFDVDWQNEASRVEFLAQLVADARRVRQLLAVTPAQHVADIDDDDDNEDDPDPSPTQNAIDTIDDIIEHDVEFDEHGQVRGIRQQAAQDRRISLTDPDMRHGRKSASQLIAGYKAQIVASLMYGFIVMVRVIKANRHDGDDLVPMAEELRADGVEPAWWGGDHAYGTLANHRHFKQHGHGELVARMARPSNGGRFTKDDFDYDFDAHTLTCPDGYLVKQKSWATRHGRKGRLFVFPGQVCSACPRRAQCVSPNAASDRGRTVFVVDEEERLIREHLRRREHPEFRARLTQRVHVERVIAGFAQCGGKQARRFGDDNVSFGANLSALAYNLRRLGTLLRQKPELEASLRHALRVFLCLVWLTLHCYLYMVRREDAYPRPATLAAA